MSKLKETARRNGRCCSSDTATGICVSDIEARCEQCRGRACVVPFCCCCCSTPLFIAPLYNTSVAKIYSAPIEFPSAYISPLRDGIN